MLFVQQQVELRHILLCGSIDFDISEPSLAHTVPESVSLSPFNLVTEEWSEKGAIREWSVSLIVKRQAKLEKNNGLLYINPGCLITD